MTFRSSARARGSRSQHTGGSAASRPAIGVPRYLGGPHKASPAKGTPAYLQRTPAKLEVGPANDTHEREADRVAAGALAPNARPTREPHDLARARDSAQSTAARALGSNGQPLDSATREHMQARYGADLGHVRVHTGAAAATLSRDVGASAFTQGRDVFFGAGYAPGVNEVTAHELAHVVQQTGTGGSGLTPLSLHGELPIQRSIMQSMPVTNGVFEVNMATVNGVPGPPPTASGFDGSIRFIPSVEAPNSNSIAMVQIARIVTGGGTDVGVFTLPAGLAPRAAVGTRGGMRTQDDPARGVQGGFFSDVHHQPNVGLPAAPPGSALSPRFPVEPAPPGTVGPIGAQPVPGRGTGGRVGQTPGFKRSNDPADIRSAALYDTPGIAAPTGTFVFDFESAAQGEDTMITYGTVTWGFTVDTGVVTNEHAEVHDTTSATFDEAMELHRDFYVHEPVTFYFDFDSSALGAGEASKIDTFLPYLTRNADVQLSLEGFADIRGSAPYNVRLARARNAAVRAELIARGVPAARITAAVATGESTAATRDAGTGDQGGNPAVGADQDREANRWANRRVVLTFSAPTRGAAPAPAPAPAPGP